MTPYLITGGSGFVLLVVALLLRRFLPQRLVIPGVVAAGIGGFAAGVGVGCGSMYEFGRDSYRVPLVDTGDLESLELVSVMPMARHSGMVGNGSNSVAPGTAPGDYALRGRAAANHPMRVGSVAPPLEAAGWLNGSAPTDAELAGKVLVVDVWADW